MIQSGRWWRATAIALMLCLGINIAAASTNVVVGDSYQRLLREAALALLKDGNSRFVSGQLKHPNLDPERRRNTVSEGQQPFAVVLACSDSREPVELIFDRGVGDLFVIRVAGNVAGESELASIEYGLGHLNCPLLLVLGHTRCGAVTAAATGAKLHGHLPKLAEKILPAVDKAKAKTKDASLLVPASIEANIWQVMEEVLRQSEEVRQLVAASKTQIVGALYDLETGEVKWLGHHPDEKNLLLAKPAAKPPPAMEHEQRSPAAAEPETDVVHSRSSPAVNPMVRPAASVH